MLTPPPLISDWPVQSRRYRAAGDASHCTLEQVPEAALNRAAGVDFSVKGSSPTHPPVHTLIAAQTQSWSFNVPQRDGLEELNFDYTHDSLGRHFLLCF